MFNEKKKKKKNDESRPKRSSVGQNRINIDPASRKERSIISTQQQEDPVGGCSKRSNSELIN